mmetsp:Transcript_9824/g.11098  ORF Transcript_9824/g.11098 Transcript_9824/m.11098 type:complete len:92 (+) Transcript_9824:89-364(+)
MLQEKFYGNGTLTLSKPTSHSSPKPTSTPTKYTGQWKNSLYHGRGTFTWPNRSQYVGEWENGREHGKGKFVSFDDKVVLDGQWSKGKFVNK